MHNNYLTKPILLTMFLALCVGARFADAQVCERFEHLTAEEMARMLDGPDRSDAECVAFLLKQLGEAKYVQASYTIATYLDFEWPKRKPAPAPSAARMSGPQDHYPAAEALFAIGVGSVPGMIRFLSGSNVTPVAHRNAIEMLLMIYREDQVKAVTELLKASRSASDTIVATRRASAAIEAANGCSTLRVACHAALLNGAVP
jgi:hypothetical protein